MLDFYKMASSFLDKASFFPQSLSTMISLQLVSLGVLSAATLLLIFLPAATYAGLGSGPGRDPFNFGNVSETCKLPPFVSQNVLGNWNNVSRFNYLMMSKEHLTRLTQHLFHSINLSQLSHKDLPRACLTVDVLPSVDATINYGVTGFGGQTMGLSEIPLGIPGLRRSERVGLVGDHGNVNQVSLTNFKDFSVAVKCWDDGVGTFIVVSPLKTLSPRNKYLVTQHLLSLGFMAENFYTFNLSRCPTTPSVGQQKEEDEY